MLLRENFTVIEKRIDSTWVVVSGYFKEPLAYCHRDLIVYKRYSEASSLFFFFVLLKGKEGEKIKRNT